MLILLYYLTSIELSFLRTIIILSKYTTSLRKTITFSLLTRIREISSYLNSLDYITQSILKSSTLNSRPTTLTRFNFPISSLYNNLHVESLQSRTLFLVLIEFTSIKDALVVLMLLLVIALIIVNRRPRIKIEKRRLLQSITILFLVALRYLVLLSFSLLRLCLRFL